MKKDLTEIVFVLDRSGSMENLVSDTIGGFNSFVKDQKSKSGSAKLTTVLFDGLYDVLYDGIDIQSVPELTNKEYFARGSTALLDALGKTINLVKNRIDIAKKKDRPSKVIFVVTTDGQENASHEFKNDVLKKMVEDRKSNGWEFIFLGANIDAFSVGMSFGVTLTSNYTPDSTGTRSVYSTVNTAVTSYREKGTVSQDWAKDVK